MFWMTLWSSVEAIGESYDRHRAEVAPFAGAEADGAVLQISVARTSL